MKTNNNTSTLGDRSSAYIARAEVGANYCVIHSRPKPRLQQIHEAADQPVGRTVLPAGFSLKGGDR